MKKRMKTRDVAFQFRMGAGFPGDVNRSHPAWIEPCLIDSVSPPLFFGEAVVIDTAADAGINGVRPLVAGDHSDATPLVVWGYNVRPYPFQQAAATNYGATAIGAGAPPAFGVTDVLRGGYIMTQIPTGQTAAKGGAVYVWCTASTGAHIQGGTEAVYSSTNTVLVANATFNGPADASGIAEIIINVN